MHFLSATKATIVFHPPKVGHLLLPHSLPLVHPHCPLTSANALTSAIATSCLLSCMPLLPYLMADCQVVAPIARGIGTRGPFPPVAAMVVMVVVVGHWRLRGTILWGAILSEACPKKTLVSETKIANAHNPGLGKRSHPERGNSGDWPPTYHLGYISYT